MPGRAPLQAGSAGQLAGVRSSARSLGSLFWRKSSGRSASSSPSYDASAESVSSRVRKLSMNSSGSRTSYFFRSASTWRAITSRKVNPSRTSSSDLARSSPIDVPSPPLSLITTVDASASAATSSATSTSASASMSSGSIVPSGTIPVSPRLDEPVVVREHLDGQRVDPVGRHLVARLLQPLVAHGPDRRVAPWTTAWTRDRPRPCAEDRAARPADRRSGGGSAARAAGGRGGDRPAPPRLRRRTPVGDRRGVRLGRHRARHRAAAGGARGSRQARHPAGRPPRPRPRLGACTPAARGPRGLLEPGGPTLGVDAIATADLVLAPGLAVDPSGMRMGKGGGCYDRALGRVPVGTPVCVVLYDHERVDRVPSEPHDRPVNAVVTPTGSDAAPDGSRVEPVLRSASSTASAAERPRPRASVGPELRLVGVVRAERVPAGPGEVHPRRVVEVGQRHHHPHRRHPVDLVAHGRVPAGRVDDRRAAAELPRPAVEQRRDRPELPDCADRAVPELELVLVAPGPVRRAAATAAGPARRGPRAPPARTMSSRPSRPRRSRTSSHHRSPGSSRRRATTSNQRRRPPRPTLVGQLVVEGQVQQVAPHRVVVGRGRPSRRPGGSPSRAAAPGRRRSSGCPASTSSR